jgi:hypothetical protein
MKRFIVNILIFILPVVIAAYSQHLYLFYSHKYYNSVTGSEIYYSITKSKQKSKTKKLLIGDSVCNQLFSNITHNDSINSLACNQAISMVGHFILLNNYLKAGNQIDTVYMIFSPFSFVNNLDQLFTYHYFLKPFYNKEYVPLFTKAVNNQIHKIPYYFICRDPIILTSNWAPNFKSKDDVNYTFLSPISVEYLAKIKDLSIKYKFRLIILPTPTKFSNKLFVEKINRNEIVGTGLDSEFKYYFENIIYINDTNFTDNVHLKDKKKYSDYYKNKLMKW